MSGGSTGNMEGCLLQQPHLLHSQSPCGVWPLGIRQRLSRHSCKAESRQTGSQQQDQKASKPSHSDADFSLLDQLPAELFKTKLQRGGQDEGGFRPPELSEDTKQSIKAAQQKFGGKLAVIAFAVRRVSVNSAALLQHLSCSSLLLH